MSAVLAETFRHVCHVCGAGTNNWTDAWSWFGSYRDLDDGKPIFKFCSEVCQTVYRVKTEDRRAELLAELSALDGDDRGGAPPYRRRRK